MLFLPNVYTVNSLTPLYLMGVLVRGLDCDCRLSTLAQEMMAYSGSGMRHHFLSNEKSISEVR